MREITMNDTDEQPMLLLLGGGASVPDDELTVEKCNSRIHQGSFGQAVQRRQFRYERQSSQ
jgi:hypothetical protein